MLIHLEKLGKSFGEKIVLHDVTASVEREDRIGIVGQNGAGKTTTLKAVAGILQFDAGEIYIDGKSIRTEPLACKRELAYIPDNPDLYDFMSGIKYLNFIADIFGVSADDRQTRIRDYAARFELTEDLAQPIAAYSHGMKQKLAIISAWLHAPQLVVMDEPFVGLDPKAALSSSPPMCWRWRKSCATRWPSSRAAGSSAPAPWRRSRATTRWSRSFWSWRMRRDAEDSREKTADGDLPQLLL